MRTSKVASTGVIALHDAGYTQSDGYEDVMEEYHESPDGIVGYCFYHEQDLERAMEGGGLMLAFGPIDPKLEDTEGPTTGQHIVRELEAEGFKVAWDGTFNRRIHLPEFVWRRRVC